MKIYLDNNILIKIEASNISYEFMQSKIQNCEFYYSYIHLQELLESTKDILTRQEKRLQTIESLTINKYLYPYNGHIECANKKPIDALKLLSLVTFIRDEIYATANKYINRDLLIKQLEINPKEINNYRKDVLIDKLNKATSQFLSTEFSSLIESGGSSIREKLVTLFNILDIIGFWKDKNSISSNLARIYDAGHVYFATYCDIFVSDDRNARNKAEVTYSYLGINTQVLSFQQFIDIPLN